MLSLTLNELNEYFEKRNYDKNTPIKIGHEVLREYHPKLIGGDLLSNVESFSLLPNYDPDNMCFVLFVGDFKKQEEVVRQIEFDDDIPF